MSALPDEPGRGQRLASYLEYDVDPADGDAPNKAVLMTLPTQEEANADFFRRSKKEWQEMGGFPNPKTVGSVGFCGDGVAAISCEAWPDPKPLDDALPAVECFAPELLPENLRPWVMDVAERTQAPVEYVAVSAMVSLGAALGRKLAIRPRMRDDWHGRWRHWSNF